MKTRSIIGIVGITFLSAVAAVMIYAKFFQTEPSIVEISSDPREVKTSADCLLLRVDSQWILPLQRLRNSVNAVVHVKTTAFRETQRSTRSMSGFLGSHLKPAPTSCNRFWFRGNHQ